MDSYPYGTLGGRSTEELFHLLSSMTSIFMKNRENVFGPLRTSKSTQMKMTDAEVMTYTLLMELKQMNSERTWHHEVSTTFARFFPNLLSRSRLIRRRIALAPVMEEFRRSLLIFFGLLSESQRFVDSKPVILCHYERARKNQNKRFRPKMLRDKQRGLEVEVEPGFAHIGYCAAKKELYFGMKLHMLCTFSGLPTVWMLTAGNIDDRRALPELIEASEEHKGRMFMELFTDNGYESEDCRKDVQSLGHNLLALPKKRSS